MQFRCKKFNFTEQLKQSVRLVDKLNPLLEIVTDIIPVLNGRDNSNNVAYLGPNRTKIHRYLVILYVAKFIPSFTLWGKDFGNSTFFTLYSLSNVAKAFRNPIHYDRTKVATNIYKRAEEKGFVEFKKVDGATYITTTEKGDEFCLKVLKDFMTLARIHSDSSSDDRFTSKGVNTLFLGKQASEYFKSLLQSISQFNNEFGEIDF